MLHQHKGHARIVDGGHAGKEGLERLQAPGRSANANDGEVLLGLCLRERVWFAGGLL